MARYSVWDSDDESPPICETDDAAEAVLAFFKHAREAVRDDGDLVDELVLVDVPEVEAIALLVPRPSTGPEAVAWITGMDYDEVVALGPKSYGKFN